MLHLFYFFLVKNNMRIFTFASPPLPHLSKKFVLGHLQEIKFSLLPKVLKELSESGESSESVQFSESEINIPLLASIKLYLRTRIARCTITFL
ncbi:hypothetical protein JTB14_008033 [Gonioctena quinquepunctata]|nr:hypothetical protein JTB14_008033 [Gonioctena quinquepunctata]